MTKTELIESMAEKAKITKKNAGTAMDALDQDRDRGRERGNKVQIVGFGTFESRKRAARSGLNPRTKRNDHDSRNDCSGIQGRESIQARQ